MRLPGCFLCYTPSPEAPPVAPAPCQAAGFVTFGCFNTLAKVTPAVRKVWARLLAAVPNSRQGRASGERVVLVSDLRNRVACNSTGFHNMVDGLASTVTLVRVRSG